MLADFEAVKMVGDQSKPPSVENYLCRTVTLIGSSVETLYRMSEEATTAAATVIQPATSAIRSLTTAATATTAKNASSGKSFPIGDEATVGAGDTATNDGCNCGKFNECAASEAISGDVDNAVARDDRDRSDGGDDGCHTGDAMISGLQDGGDGHGFNPHDGGSDGREQSGDDLHDGGSGFDRRYCGSDGRKGSGDDRHDGSSGFDRHDGDSDGCERSGDDRHDGGSGFDSHDGGSGDGRDFDGGERSDFDRLDGGSGDEFQSEQ